MRTLLLHDYTSPTGSKIRNASRRADSTTTGVLATAPTAVPTRDQLLPNSFWEVRIEPKAVAHGSDTGDGFQACITGRAILLRSAAVVSCFCRWSDGLISSPVLPQAAEFSDSHGPRVRGRQAKKKALGIATFPGTELVTPTLSIRGAACVEWGRSHAVQVTGAG
jgi:hypothetical protein